MALALRSPRCNYRRVAVERDATFASAPALGEKCRGAASSQLLGETPAKRTTWRGTDGGTLQLWTGTSLERLDVDKLHGPRVLQPDGSTGFMAEAENWSEMHSSDQKVLSYKAARRNKQMRVIIEERALRDRELAWEMAANASPEARMRMRAERERGRQPLFWPGIDIQTVSDNHQKVAPGIMYGMDFPWNEETLMQFGPEWVTKAFHACGSISKGNRVVKVFVEETKITAGNNSGKFLFDVEYEKEDRSLHTRLFAKIPFPLAGATKSDRFSSSVYKQPMDFYEVNTYRLFETCFPMKTPRFYFGDISPLTSNFILITERIDFAELDGIGKRALKPFEIEGPYEKCKDFELKNKEKEYYLLLLVVTAKVAAHHKIGSFGPEGLLWQSLGMKTAAGRDRGSFGCNPAGATGLPPADFSKKLEMAYDFVSVSAKVLYPDYVASKAFEEKFKRTMMTRAAYNAEIDFWKHEDDAYVALGHQNLNIDNAYFWRDGSGALDCGVYDFGGFGSSCLGHKIYWMFNCAEFDQFKENIEEYLDAFVETYAKHGGPAIDKKVLKAHVLLTTLENMQMMVLAVPNCFTMCSSKEWESIKDRHDPRISGNIGGKSTLRTTLHCLGNGIRILEELKADEVLETWIKEVYVGKWGLEAKSDAVIFGS